MSEITKSTSSSGNTKSPQMPFSTLAGSVHHSQLVLVSKKTSMDIEEQYGFNFRDSQVQMLIRRPIIINTGEQQNYKDKSAFQKPVKCPGCSSLILRDPAVVDNNVVCPNSKCEKEFCWICLKATLREEDEINHFDDRNYLECSGRQFYDVREKSKLQVCCERVRMILCIPWINIYETTRSSIQAIHKQTSYYLTGLNKYLKWFLLILFVYIYLIPITFIFSGLIVGTLYGVLSCLSQIGITFKICCRNISCCVRKQRQTSKLNDRNDIMQKFVENEKVQFDTDMTSSNTTATQSVLKLSEKDS